MTNRISISDAAAMLEWSHEKYKVHYLEWRRIGRRLWLWAIGMWVFCALLLMSEWRKELVMFRYAYSYTCFAYVYLVVIQNKVERRIKAQNELFRTLYSAIVEYQRRKGND